MSMKPISPLSEITLDELTEALKTGSVTSVDLVKVPRPVNIMCGTCLRLTETNPDALAIAAARDEERSKDKLRGSLHGIPILIKNNIATFDKTNNTAGSHLLLGASVSRDAAVAKRLREAGAVLIGRCNMTQWANFRSDKGTKPMDGWSAQGGQTLGAYHDKQNPSGSSSGGGVATDLGLAFATLGTETDGSIVSPSERNNIVGIKPTVGLTSRDLVIPITEHQDTVGPMARTVRDAAAILQIIAGKDSNDKYTGAIPDVPDYVAACKLDALKGARLGVPWIAIMAIEEGGIEFEIAVFRDSLKVFEDAGAVIVEADFESTMDEIEPLQQTMFRADFPVNIARYFSQLDQNPSGVKDVQDMLEMTQTHTNEGYPDRNTASWERVLEQGWDNADNERFTKLLDSYKEICEQKGLPGTLEKHNLDAIIMPTTEASTWSAVAGAPMVTVPLGFHPADAAVSWDETHSLVNTGPGVPFGMSFSGSKWSEAKLIGYAYAFEQRTMAMQKGVRVVSLPKTEIGAVY